TLSREHKERGHEAYALRLLGEITSRRAPPDVEQAENHYRQAMALAEELAMHPLLAHCRRGLGALYSCVGRLEQARAELSAAIELYRAMEMPFWLTRAEATLAEVRRQHDGRKVQGRDEEQRRPNIGERERKRD